jgi:hypothetical protein
MVDLIAGYKATFCNLGYLFVILFLLQYFYNIVQLRHRMEIMAENQKKEASVAIIEISKEIEIEVEKPSEILKEKTLIQPKKSFYSAGSIIDMSVHNTIALD